MEARPHGWPPQLRRPQGLDPPTDRRLDANYSLDRYSLDSIQYQEYLDDSVINTFFRNLCVAQPGQSVAFDSNGLDFLLTSQYESPTPLTQAEIDEHYRLFRTQAATVTANNGLVFMPFCVRSHWILAVTDFQRRIIRIYDSLCDPDGRVNQENPLVRAILPIVMRTLSFCHDEHRWAVELMWLPIEVNYTECGVYICLMALQHSYMRNFTCLDYVDYFRDANGFLSLYKLDACYFLAGRLIIFQVCKRFFRRAEDLSRTRAVESHLMVGLQVAFDSPLAQQQVDGFNTYHEARSHTLHRVDAALWWFIYSIEKLGSPQYLQVNEGIRGRAREVVLSEAGEQFRDEIVHEAMQYAWHDVEPLMNFKLDLSAASNLLDINARIQLAISRTWAAQLAWPEMPAWQPSGIIFLDTPSSPVEEEHTVQSPSTTHLETIELSESDEPETEL